MNYSVLHPLVKINIKNYIWCLNHFWFDCMSDTLNIFTMTSLTWFFHKLICIEDSWKVIYCDSSMFVGKTPAEWRWTGRRKWSREVPRSSRCWWASTVTLAVRTHWRTSWDPPSETCWRTGASTSAPTLWRSTRAGSTRARARRGRRGVCATLTHTVKPKIIHTQDIYIFIFIFLLVGAGHYSSFMWVRIAK